MTTEKTEKVKPAFYIFAQSEDGKTQQVGAAFAHKTGKGFNLVIGDKRYSAFPPRT